MQLCQSSCWLRVALSRIRAVSVAGRHLAHETCGRWAVSGAVSSLSDRGLWWHIFPVHPFTLAPFFAFRLICLSYINKSFVMKMSYLLHRAKLLRVTSSSTWRGITSLPVKTLNCHISRTRHTSIPVFVLNCDQVTSILYTKNRAISPTGYLTLICAVWSSRGRSYLLPLSHRADVECLRHLLISVKLVTNINSTTVMWHTFHYRDLT